MQKCWLYLQTLFKHFAPENGGPLQKEIPGWQPAFLGSMLVFTVCVYKYDEQRVDTLSSYAIYISCFQSVVSISDEICDEWSLFFQLLPTPPVWGTRLFISLVKAVKQNIQIKWINMQFYIMSVELQF